MSGLTAFGIIIGVIGIVIMVYAISLLGEADYLTTRGGFAVGFIITILGGVIAFLPYQKKP